MKKLASLTVVIVMALAFVAVVPQTTTAQEENTQSTESSENQPATYNYVTQEGDSYTLMARKAVQTYGIVNEVSLTPAQIIYAETNLTQAANEPQLSTGDEVSIEVSAAENWVNKAKELSEEQQAGWEAYVPYVNFNTDSVGEPRK